MVKNIYMNRYLDTHRGFSTGVWHILKMWRGSVFKIIWFECLIFLTLYSIICAIYRCLIFEYPTYRQTFEIICIYMGRFSNLIPMTFICGFYVSQVVSRWWDQFTSLPWPDQLVLKMVGYVHGKGDDKKILRKNVARYINLSTVLVFRLVSRKVRSRFPNIESLVDAKLLLPHEAEHFKLVEDKTPHEVTWIPILWAIKLLQKARDEGYYSCEAAVFNGLLQSFDMIEMSNRKILNYGWINFPLAYTQVATFTVYTYFFAALFGRQNLYPSSETNIKDHHSELFPSSALFYSALSPFSGHTPNLYFPFFTLVELFCYVGWIKVAATLLNPFGDDDEDFKVNYLIDRNLQVSYLIVDEADREMQICEDPFQKAGIDIPSDLPFPNDDKTDLNLDESKHETMLTALDQLRKNSISSLFFHRSRSFMSSAEGLHEGEGEAGLAPRHSINPTSVRGSHRDISMTILEETGEEKNEEEKEALLIEKEDEKDAHKDEKA